MPYLILAIGVLIGVYALYRFFLNADVKQIKAFFLTVIAGVLALAILLLAVTGRLPAALALLVALLPFAVKFYQAKTVKKPGESSSSNIMTRREALEVLGLGEGAGKKEINATYKKLMQKVHPDSEGSDWMAAKLNQARDILLKK